MKKVALIGDSIRLHYEETVRRELAGIADVGTPAENGGTSENVLNHLDEWAVSLGVDIVHVNCGLHDIKTPFDSDQRNIPIHQYERNVREILHRLTTATDATIVWAATTPVNYQWHHERKTFDRYEQDVVAYNGAAAKVASEFGVAIDDLYSVVMDAGRDDCLSPDGVHYKPEARVMLGKAVAAFIRPLLAE